MSPIDAFTWTRIGRLSRTAGSPETRADVLWLLGEARVDAAIPNLLEGLKARAQIQRTEAAKALGRFDSKQVFPGLRALLCSRRPHVRADACFALSQLLDARAVDVLLDVAGNPRERPDVRAQAIEAIGSTLELSATTSSKYERARALLEKMVQDQHAQVRFWACYALGVMGSKKSRALLEARVSDDALGWQGKTVGHEARWALRKIQGTGR